MRPLSIDIDRLSPISNLVAWRRGVLESTCSYATLFHLSVRGRNRTLLAGAQQISRKEPALYAGTERADRVEAAPPGLRLRLRKPREFALAPLSEAESAHLAERGVRLKTGIRRTMALACDGFGRVGNHLGRCTDLAYGDPFSGFARDASGIRRLLCRRGQGLGTRRQPGGRPVHRTRPVRRRTFLERRGILRVGHRGVRARDPTHPRNCSRLLRSAPFPIRHARQQRPPPLRRKIPRTSANSTPTATRIGRAA